MSAVENLISQFEDMCGESDTELGNEAKTELEELLALLQRSLPYIQDMVGIASDARFLVAEIKERLDEHGLR